MEPASCRTLFPALEEQTFFNHAGIAPCSTRVITAMRTVLNEQACLGSAGYRLWTERITMIRKLAAQFLGTDPGEIAFVANTSTGLSLVAEALSWQSGDTVLVPVPDFPANVYPWKNLMRRGVRVVELPRRNGWIEVSDAARALTPETRVLALSSIDFVTGFAADLAAFGAFCRDHNLTFVVDAIQSLGMLPIDVKRCGIHVLVAGAHKWLCGPQGIGLLYVDRRLQSQLAPPIVGWKSVTNEEDFSIHFVLRPDAAVFEPGTQNVSGIAGLGAALELLSEIGSARIQAQVEELVELLFVGLERRGWQLLSPRHANERGGIVTFSGDNDSMGLYRHLSAGGVVSALRDGHIRLSPHFANNRQDIERFFAVLDNYSRK